MGMRLAKISGTLQEMSGEELARQQGLSAAPPTPLGAQGLGASQDVAKMAGTPNQIRAMVQDSLQERTRTSDLLGESERTNGRRRYTVDSLQERMNVLEGLGTLSNRVPEYVRTQLKTAETIAVPNSVNKDAVTAHLASLGITDGKAVADAQAALDKVRMGTATPKDINDALAALKIDATITDSTTSLAQKLQPFFSEAGVEDIKKQMVGVLQNYSDVKMKELPDVVAQFANQQNNINDVAALLGLSDEAFGELTLGQVQAQLKAWKGRNFQDVDALRSVLEDPTYSLAEKDFARERLAEMGAIGVTSIEQKTENLEAQVAAGDAVTVGGVRVKVSEIMSDPKLKAVVATALDNPEELAKLEKTDADLAKWVTNNKNALVKVRNELLAGTKEFADRQKEFSDKLGDAATAHKTFLDSAVPGWNKAKDIGWTEWLGAPAAEGKEATGLYKDSPTIAHTLSMTDTAKRGYALSALAKLTPTQAKTFSTTFLDQIAATATNDIEAQQFMDDYLATENKDWKASITPEVPAVKLDEDFSQAELDSLVSTAVQDRAPGFKNLTDLVNKINQLANGTPKDRTEARKLSAALADIKGQLNRDLRPESIQTRKDKNRGERETKEFGASMSALTSAVEQTLKDLSGRSGNNWLRNRGTDVLAPLKGKASSIAMEASLGNITKAEARKQVEELRGQMARELAAFLGDGNTKPGDALDAAEQIAARGLVDKLSPAEKKMIADRIAKDVHVQVRDKNNLSSVEKLLNIYRAFGGTENIAEAASKKAMSQTIGTVSTGSYGY